MKRTILYLVIFVAVVAAIAYIVIRNTDPGTISESDKSFNVADTAQIGKIFIADKSNNIITLKRQDDNAWIVNDKYLARQSEVKTLLTTIRQVQTVAPVAKAARNNVVKAMAADNTKVEIYNRNGKLIKSYFVGAPTTAGEGNYMKLENSDQIFAVNIPGFAGHLSSRYFTEERDWRDREVFGYQPEEIKEVSINYRNDPDASFSIHVYSRDSFELKSATGAKGNTDKRAVAKYLNHYQFIHAEAFANDHPAKDSVLSQQKPFASITVVTNDGETNEVPIYHKAVSKRTKAQFDPEGNPLDYDLERYFAVINDGEDFVIIQDFVFGKLLKKYSDFLEKSKRKA